MGAGTSDAEITSLPSEKSRTSQGVGRSSLAQLHGRYSIPAVPPPYREGYTRHLGRHGNLIRIGHDLDS